MPIANFALTSSELGVSSFTVNSIFVIALSLALALPMIFLFKKGKGSALSKF
tara:strand:+ start:885 stop:1040 length:156 start_codon:yes stop_codon:yes gene_type:complete